MNTLAVETEIKCYHCGNTCENEAITIEEKHFCCEGCKTVYEILSENSLEDFYNLEETGGRQKVAQQAEVYAYLELPDVKEKLVTYTDGQVSMIQLQLPTIHCSSCIWLLERLHQLHKGVRSCQVNFQKRTARITYAEQEITLSEIAALLASIGYPPRFNLAGLEKKSAISTDKKLIYQLGVAGFAFGNIMLLSLPEYFDMHSPELDTFSPFFRYLSLLLSLPVLLYSSQGYYISAWKGLKSGHLNIDVPIVLGIVVLFLRSVYEIAVLNMPGYFDSLAGLLFFLLMGKWFQRRTYDALSFDRDYKSYFPIAVTKIDHQTETQVPIYELRVGDRIRVRNEELVPADAILRKGEGLIDASFVTGEAIPVPKSVGEKIFAGGKQKGASIEVEIIKPVDQSYLTELWNDGIFAKEKTTDFTSITDKVSENFTKALLVIAIGGFVVWSFFDVPTAFYVFTAVLIVACPCALALAAPFTLGNGLLILGKNKFYAKSSATIENMATVDTLVFDKTGTLTSGNQYQIAFEGAPLSTANQAAIKSVVMHSNHPLSRQLFSFLKTSETSPVQQFEEIVGGGVQAQTPMGFLRAGSAKWLGLDADNHQNETRVYVSLDGQTLGYFKFNNTYRKGLDGFTKKLQATGYQLSVLSGDHAGEQTALTKIFGPNTPLAFKKGPKEKLEFIGQLSGKGHKVLMVGDGLNDAGALQKAAVGIAVSEDVHAFTPACDAIVDAKNLMQLPLFLEFAKRNMRVINQSFKISLAYNMVGLSFALAGVLTPIYCAILMPLSSISVVAFVTIASRRHAKQLGLQTTD